MSGYWLTVLTTFASVAVALVGFAGLLTAFRSSGEKFSLPDIVGIRVLLIFSLGALIFALLPLLLVREDGEWDFATAVLGAFLLFWPLRSPSWNRSRSYRPRRPVIYWSLQGVMGLFGLSLLGLAAARSTSAIFYASGVGLCLLIALVAFVSQVFALLSADAR